LEQNPLWQFVEQHSGPLAQDWPSTLQLPPGRLAQVPLVHVPVQQSFGPEQAPPTSVHCLLPQLPLTQLLRQQSVSTAQEPPGAWQNVGSVHVVPSQTPLQHGLPETHARPELMQAPPATPPSGRSTIPPSGPPSEPLFWLFPPLLTEPAQSHAAKVTRPPMAQRTRNARDWCIEGVL